MPDIESIRSQFKSSGAFSAPRVPEYLSPAYRTFIAACKLTGFSFPEIARHLGKNHAGLIHHHKRLTMFESGAAAYVAETAARLKK